MFSHTVPKKLLEHFAYFDPVPSALRLWRYQKGEPVYGRAALKSATRWDGHFADPTNAAKEAEIELRLKREFEDPVNDFIDFLAYETFAFTSRNRRLLSRYITMLFHRTCARRDATPGQHERMLNALRSLRDNEERLKQVMLKQTMDLLPNGLPVLLTREDAMTAINEAIAEQSTADAPQRRYLQTLETMMSFVDERMRRGEWRITRTTPEHPFVIGDAPVVTWERTEENNLIFGQGFGRPNVEVFLPIFPTACLHILPAVERTRHVLSPSVDEVNRAQAAIATRHCFTNIRSEDIDMVLQPYFGTVRLGIEGFNLDHVDLAEKFFEILMRHPPYAGPLPT